VGAQELLRYRIHGSELSLNRSIDRSALESAGIASVLDRARPKVRDALLRFLHLVAAAWADGGRSLTGSHPNLARLCGWSPRTARYWLPELERVGALVVDGRHDANQAGPHRHSRGCNLYHAGLALHLAARASGIEPLSRELAERAGQVAELRARFDGTGGSCQPSGSGSRPGALSAQIRKAGNSPAGSPGGKVAALIPGRAAPLQAAPSAPPPPPPPPEPPAPQEEAGEGKGVARPAAGDAPAAPRQAAPARRGEQFSLWAGADRPAELAERWRAYAAQVARAAVRR
jgi:hypothetical protein